MNLNGVAEIISILGVELAHAIISAYATAATIRLVFAMVTRRPIKYARLIEGIGGLIYLVGLIFWRYSDYPGGYNYFLLTKSVGLAMIIFPQLIADLGGETNDRDT